MLWQWIGSGSYLLDQLLDHPKVIKKFFGENPDYSISGNSQNHTHTPCQAACISALNASSDST